jgi:hypothetical protein
MALDLTSIIQSAPQVFRDLPFILNLVQLVFYASLVLTFGGFIMKAYKGFLSWPMRILGRLIFGVLALICGIGISWVIPPFSNQFIYNIVQTLFINIILGAAIASLVIFVNLRMISYHIFNLPGIEKSIKHLQEMKVKAGEVEKEEQAKNRIGIRHPVRIAGLVGFAVFLVFGLVGFQGFPNVLAELGLTQQDLDMMAEQVEFVNTEYGDRIGEILGDSSKLQECSGAVELMQDQETLSSMQTYTNPSVKQMVEDYTGETVTEMFSIQAEPGFYVFSMTQNKACLSTLSVVCVCEDIGDIQ